MQSYSYSTQPSAPRRLSSRRSLRDFIKYNRSEIDAVIRRRCPNVGSLNDEDRRGWILNEEGLYLWARSEGVRV